MTPKRKSREGTKAAVKFRFNFQRLETHVDMTTKQCKIHSPSHLQDVFIWVMV